MEWADTKRILPPESPEPGRWRTSRIPFFDPIMRRASDPDAELIIVCCGAQMGKTESMMCIAGHRLDDGPFVPVLWIAPTQKSVKSLADDRFMKMLRSTPALWAKLEKGRRNRVVEKFISGIRVGFGWAGSATELASHPAGMVLIDERDRMLNDVEGEGDPLTLARARTKNYSLRKILVSSTPTLEGASPIWSLFKEGTREKWSWPCPHCQEYFVPELKLLKWPDKATPGEARAAAFVACPHCGGKCRDEHKTAMNAAGRYQAHVVDEEQKEVPIPMRPQTVMHSFWISGLCSPWQTYGEIAELLVAAYRSREPERIQGVVNTYGGEIWRMQGEAPPWESVLRTRAGYMPGAIPLGVRFLTMGVDVQADRLYWVVRGWGINAESWLLDYGELFGQTEYDTVWIGLDGILHRPFGDMHVARAFIDSGYKPGSLYKRPDNVIYTYCQRNRGLAFPTKGHDMQDRPLKTADLNLTEGGRPVRAGLKLWHIDTNHVKTWVYSRLNWPAGEPGGWHTYQTVDEEYCRQVVNEEVVVKASGRRVWIEKGPNHWLDCESLCYAAALSLNVYALREEVSAPPASEQNPVQSRFRRATL